MSNIMHKLSFAKGGRGDLLLNFVPANKQKEGSLKSSICSSLLRCDLSIQQTLLDSPSAGPQARYMREVYLTHGSYAFYAACLLNK
jgi:hypothetical protein